MYGIYDRGHSSQEVRTLPKPIVFLTVLLVLSPLRQIVASDNAVTFEELLSRLQQTEERVRELEQQAGMPFRQSSQTRLFDEPLPIPPVTDYMANATEASRKAAGTNTSDDSEIADSADEENQPTFEERLKKLEEGWKELDEAWTTFDKAEEKKKADAKKKPTFKINGRIHADFWDFLNDNGGVGFLENPIAGDGADGNAANDGVDPRDRFKFRRIRLEMKGDILESMYWRTQIDFNNPQTAEMKDVFIGFKNLPNNYRIQIGNQKRPLGLDSLNSSRFNVFLERPFVTEAFNEDARRPGICFYSNTDDESLIWQYGAFYLENITTDGRYLGDERQMSVNFRVAGSPWYDECSDGQGYFHWAVAGMVAHPDGTDDATSGHRNEARFRSRPEARSSNRWLNTGRVVGADWFETIGLESIFNVGPLQITGELMQNYMQRDGFADTQFHGGYIYANYMLTGEHIPYDRKSGTLGRLKPFEDFFLADRCDRYAKRGWGAWGVAARYSYLDISDADVLGGVGESATLAVNWHWNAYAKLQFNLIYGDIDNRDPITGTTGGTYLIAGTRFAVDF